MPKSQQVKTARMSNLIIFLILALALMLAVAVFSFHERSSQDSGAAVSKTDRAQITLEMIGMGSAYQDAFAGGTLTHTFLDVNDYHRYHFPVSGTILEVRKIPSLDAVGGIISWDHEQKKYLLWDENPGWQSIETRDCLIMDTEHGLMGEPYAIID